MLLVESLQDLDDRHVALRDLLPARRRRLPHADAVAVQRPLGELDAAREGERPRGPWHVLAQAQLRNEPERVAAQEACAVDARPDCVEKLARADGAPQPFEPAYHARAFQRGEDRLRRTSLAQEARVAERGVQVAASGGTHELRIEIGLEHVVRVGERDVFAAREVHAAVTRGGYAEMLLPDDPGRPVAAPIGLEDLARAVGRAVVDQDDLAVDEALGIQAVQHLRQPGRGVVDRNDDG